MTQKFTNAFAMKIILIVVLMNAKPAISSAKAVFRQLTLVRHAKATQDGGPIAHVNQATVILYR